MSAAGESTVSAAGETTVTTAGVSTVTTARVTTGVTASVTTGVTFLGLVVLGYLDALLDVVQLNADDSFMGHAVNRSGSAVVGRDTVTRVAGRRLLVSLVLDLVFKDDVLDFVEQMRVDVVALGSLVADGDGGVMAAAAQGAVAAGVTTTA